MYYFAILAPEEIDKEVMKWKKIFKERFNCTKALNSPAHITLIAPFWMHTDLETEIFDSLKEFCGSQKGLSIHLKDFSAFKPKVIFIDVLKNEFLDSLQKDFIGFMINRQKFPVKKDENIFHPHITLATRDLFKKDFSEAWELFSNRKYEKSWIATGISLLRHNKKNWDVIYTSQFSE
jgi:2'-5' RNA ligase